VTVLLPWPPRSYLSARRLIEIEEQARGRGSSRGVYAAAFMEPRAGFDSESVRGAELSQIPAMVPHEANPILIRTI
jgi:hypothetical protein